MIPTPPFCLLQCMVFLLRHSWRLPQRNENIILLILVTTDCGTTTEKAMNHNLAKTTVLIKVDFSKKERDF